MGIPSYFSYIIRNHPEIIQLLIDLVRIDNLYLDSNSIIYDVVRKTPQIMDETHIDYEKRLYVNICHSIDKYLNTIRPLQRVMIAFDGVAPLAKLRQQRERRHKSLFTRWVCSDETNAVNSGWDTTAITSGTRFMDGLNEFVIEYYGTAMERKWKYNEKVAQWLPRELIVSGSNIAGEGEHKIFEFIRENPHIIPSIYKEKSATKQTQKSQRAQQSQNTVIYGLDADLIVLGLNHLRFFGGDEKAKHRLFLAREAPHFAKEFEGIEKMSKMKIDQETLYCLNVQLLGEEIVKQITNEYKMSETVGSESEKKIASAKLMDYTLLTFFLGNDFLPHFPSLNIRTTGMDLLLDTYKSIFSATETICTPEGKIQWAQLSLLISALAKNEQENFKQEMTLRAKSEFFMWKKEEEESKMLKQQIKKSGETKAPSKEEQLNRMPILYRSVEKYIDPHFNGWEGRYYESLFRNNERENMVKMVCKEYMQGLEWTLDYYSFGCRNLRWKYNYHYAPLLSDLAPMIPHFNVNFVKEDYRPLHPIVQLAYVLPVESLHLLGETTKQHLLCRLPDFYVKTEELEFQWAFCKFFWEGHPILPERPIEDIETILLYE